jgi:general secretion pathway protein H
MTWLGEPTARPTHLRRRPRSAASSGFTLIEMIVVLVVLGLTLALFAVRGPMRSRGLELRAAAEQLAQSLRAARGEAITAGRVVDVTLTAGGYRIGNGRLHAVPGVSILASTASGTVQTGIRFAPDGSSSGAIVTLEDRTSRISIAVEWLTGRVRIADAP